MASSRWCSRGRGRSESSTRRAGIPRTEEAVERQTVQQLSRPVYNLLLSFLAELESKRIAYTLDHVRTEAIMVSVAVPGERWEVEYLEDGSVDVERFVSTGDIGGEPALTELFDAHGS